MKTLANRILIEENLQDAEAVFYRKQGIETSTRGAVHELLESNNEWPKTHQDFKDIEKTIINKWVEAGKPDFIYLSLEPRATEVRKIQVVSKKWVDKAYGNTYHAVKYRLDDGDFIVIPGIDYGYALHQAEYMAIKHAVKNGYLPEIDRNRCALYWCQENDVEVTATVTEVKYKKDLKFHRG